MSLALRAQVGSYNPRVRTRLFIIAILNLIIGCSAEDKATLTGARADRVVVIKKEHTLTLISQARVLKTYKIALGRDPYGPKVRQGDHRTPEGIYLLDRRKSE
jgi:murein L,D-transpeptidase YafK